MSANLHPIFAGICAPYAAAQARYDREQDAAFDRELYVEREVNAAMADAEQIAEALGDIALDPVAAAIARVDAAPTIEDRSRAAVALCDLFRTYFAGRVA